jgi:AAA family ATP:ADP antiporter
VAIAFAAGFLLCGYELIRSSSTSLYIEAYGADRLPYAMVAGTVFTAIFLYGYGWVLTWTGPRRTLLLTSLFSAFVIVCCYLALRRGIGLASGIAYALREAYIVVIIEQYWSFINSTLREGQAKKLNGPITGVGSLGAILGGLMVGRLARPIGTEALLLLAAVSLLPAAFCSELSYRLGGEPAPSEKERGRKSLALSLFAESSYLRRIGLLIVLTQVISTTFDLRFSILLEQSLPIKDARTAYLGNFYATLNASAFVLQFIAAPLLLSYVSLKFIHPAIPIAHIATAIALIIRPSLFTGGLAYLVFKSLDYSVFRAGKEIFYIPLSFDSRYRAKEVIDSFGYRASKGGAAGLASLAVMIFKTVPGAGYPSAALASALGWFALVRKLVRQHDEMLKQPYTASESPQSIEHR